MKLFLALLFSLSISSITNAQQSFVRDGNITVLNINGDTLKNPWAGGLNAIQFSEIDLNLDGINDLFAFDRTGNRISTYINSGLANQIEYTYDPSYIQFFPKGLHDWVLLRDFNCDGKIDIFHSSDGGIGTYTNTSTSQLNFTIDTNQIYSDFQPDSTNPSFSNLYVNSANLPAFDDIDNDGDLDILTLSIIGGRAEYHKNLSMEKNGDCSQLDFQLANRCWGFFKEDPNLNKVLFYDTCFINIANPEKTINNNKHLGGSSFLTLDIDGNNSKDLILGGNSYNNLLLLTNNDVSTNLTASSVTHQELNFPENNLNTQAVKIEHFVAGFYIDVNNNGIKDLICSTNSTASNENTNNNWLYNNNNLNNNPNFNFLSKAFLQDGMIEVGEGSFPTFFDYNNDGLKDLVIGNYGIFNNSLPESYKATFWLYQNTGTQNNPAFTLIDSNYINISSLNLDVINNKKTLRLIPTFGDLDNDGDKDLIIGDYKGYLHYFENTANAGSAANFVLNQTEYFNINVTANAAPQIIDLDKDGKLDLVIGKQNGYFSYYKNTGTAALPTFTLITDSLGDVNTKKHNEFIGNSCPNIYDENGVYTMLSGSFNGNIYRFSNIDGNLNGTFSIDSNYLNIWEGINSKVTINDVNSDNFPDLVIGNYAGGAAFYKGIDLTSVSELTNKTSKITAYPNPSSNQIKIDLGNNATQNANIKLVSLLGKVLIQKNVTTNSVYLNLSGFSNGIYLVHFTNELGLQTLKIVKK
ncbi:MAG: T9SS type A sorting domain-containing protein [Vicingaceae bacterium]